MVVKFDEKHYEYINSGKMFTISVISPTTNFPYLTPAGGVCHENKLYIGIKNDTAKYRFISQGSDKVGVMILDHTKYSYLSVIGIAKLYNQETIDTFETIMTLISENYLSKEDAVKQTERVLEEGDWYLMEVTPTKIISVNQRGGFN